MVGVFIFLVLALAFIFFIFKVQDKEAETQSLFKNKLLQIKNDLDEKEKILSKQYGECTRKVIANFDTKENYDLQSRIEFAQKYGIENILKVVDELSISTVNTLDYLYVFQQTETLIINNNPYKFSDILNYDVEDTPTTQKGESVATTKSNTRSMVGRAIVGDLVAGPAGMVLGGATGKKTTIIKNGEDNLIHNYTINITINNLQKPIESINTKNDSKATSEIVSILNIIIKNNNSK